MKEQHNKGYTGLTVEKAEPNPGCIDCHGTGYRKIKAGYYGSVITCQCRIFLNWKKEAKGTCAETK